jgi:hypothetical protein
MVIGRNGVGSMDEFDKGHGNEGFKQLGATHVRLLLSGGGLPRESVAPAAAWLAEIDEREGTRLEAIRHDQIALARSTEKAAWLGALSAIAATLIGLGILLILLLKKG